MSSRGRVLRTDSGRPSRRVLLAVPALLAGTVLAAPFVAGAATAAPPPGKGNPHVSATPTAASVPAAPAPTTAATHGKAHQPHTPPGQAKKTGTAPGQAKKNGTPPGQAKHAAPPAAVAVPNHGNKNPKVTLCHATPPATAANGWVEITVSANAVVHAGHGNHADDIIPAFAYNDHGTGASYPGKNLTTLFGGVAGAVILQDGCTLPAAPSPVSSAAAPAAPTSQVAAPAVPQKVAAAPVPSDASGAPDAASAPASSASALAVTTTAPDSGTPSGKTAAGSGIAIGDTGDHGSHGPGAGTTALIVGLIVLVLAALTLGGLVANLRRRPGAGA